VNNREIRIDLNELDQTIRPQDQAGRADKHSIKELMDKLCIKSNQIVNKQLKLDKLNSTVKTLNILKSMDLNHCTLNPQFEITHSLNHDLTIDFQILNKNLLLEDNFAHNNFKLTTSIQFSSNVSSVWHNKQEQFQAIKPNTKHCTKFYIEDFIQSKRLFPNKFDLHLSFDVRNYLRAVFSSNGNIIKEKLNIIHEFEEELFLENSQILGKIEICFFSYDFKLCDYLLNKKDSDRVFELNNLNNVNLIFDMFLKYYSMVKNKNREECKQSVTLEELWNGITIEGYVKNENESFLDSLSSNF
jgi:hypothetical protein